jgi:hypothetical protein
MSTVVKKQHYVWAHHLGAWEIDGVVWCHLAEQKKFFPTNRGSLANETYFYRAQKLTAGDLASLDHLINRSSDARLRDVNRGWVQGNQECFEVRQAIEDSRLPPAAKTQAVLELDNHAKTRIERWHTHVELAFQPWLEELREGRTGFYADLKARHAFISYLCFQYFRTANMRRRMLEVMQPVGDFDPNRTWGVVALIFSTNVASSLVRSHASYKIGVLDNATSTPLITADQPVINLLPIEREEELMFYFPVSPRRAIVFGPADRVGPDRRDLSLLEIEQRNHQLFSRSSNQTYSGDRAYLEALVAVGKLSPAG